MKKLSEEKYNTELVSLTNNFSSAGIELSDEIRDLIMNSPCSMSEETGVAFPGGLACHINLLTAIALKMSKMISGTFDIDAKSLYKVCTCMHLSKLEMFIPNDNQWEINNRGLNYKFATSNVRLKFGERSIMYAQNKLNVTFTPEEWEAMECMDKENEDKNNKYYDGILSVIVRQSNELAVAIEKERYKNTKV